MKFLKKTQFTMRGVYGSIVQPFALLEKQYIGTRNEGEKPMKKRIALALAVCMIMSVLIGTVSMAYAKDDTAANEQAVETVEESIAYDDAVQVTSNENVSTTGYTTFFDTVLYVEKNEASGLPGRLNVNFKKLSFTGTVYLPGSATPDGLFISWNDDELSLSKDGVTYKSGEVPVPMVGESVKYTVKRKSIKAVITIKTMKASSEVASMFLNLDETLGTIDAMNSDETHETKCFGSVNFDNETYDYLSIKGRGNSTWGFDKKPYNITFYKAPNAKKGYGAYDKKDKVELVDGVKAKQWSLIANYLDNSLMRNKIGLDLADKLGIGLKTRFVDLYMNGEYLGNYLLTPKNDYKAPDGGYALENDNYLSTAEDGEAKDYQFTLPGMKEIGNVVGDGYYSRITIKDLGDDAVDAGETRETVEQYVVTAWNALLDYDSEDYQNYFDMDSWAKMYLMYEVAKTYDAFSGSILMHRDGLTADDKLIAGPVWDLDTTFGRTMYKFFVGITLPRQLSAQGWYVDSIGLSANKEPVSLLQELGKHPSFMKHVANIYSEYKTAFDEIVEDVNVQQMVLSDSADMNNDLWGLHHLGVYFVPVPLTVGTGKYQLNYKITDSWDAYVDNLREYTSKRVMYLTDNLYVEAPSGSILGDVNAVSGGSVTLTANVTSGNSANSFIWQSSTDGVTWTDIEGATDSTLVISDISADQNGTMYRCVVTNRGNDIVTIHTGVVENTRSEIFAPVTLSVTEKKTEDTPKADEKEDPSTPSSDKNNDKTSFVSKVVSFFKRLFRR